MVKTRKFTFKYQNFFLKYKKKYSREFYNFINKYLIQIKN